MAERITPRDKDFAQWYADVIAQAKLADFSPVRGCMVFRPNGYALWEVVQKYLDKRFKETGHRNAYFPMFIPESFLNKEKEHVEGFAPECAVVTHGGGKKLEEPLIVRPTSETIINAMYAKWIQSYRDLPLLINQWANVVRWEMRTRPFLRTTEFLWQEGHTCHADEEEAMKETLKMLDVYRSFFEDVLAIPTVPGEKTPGEKFAGAEKTYSIEVMLQDKRALQAATSHYFGTRFAKAFEIKFQDKEGKQQYVHQTTWGLSTRSIGALIMTHSDDQGLVLPPKAAPTQCVIIPIPKKGADNTEIMNTVSKLHEDLSKHYSCELDVREGYSPGYKFNEWETQGVPLRVELGPRDLEQGVCTIKRRDGHKIQLKIEDVVKETPNLLNAFQKALYQKAKERLDSNTFVEDDYDRFKKRLEEEGGFYLLPYDPEDKDFEKRLKEECKATTRCLPFHTNPIPGKRRVLVAKSY
ncbi:MAG: proline--tRNA ligase [Bdellovibrionota bacterium]